MDEAGNRRLCVQFVVRIKRSNLVTLCKSRIVEGRRQEIVQPSSEPQYRLPDVDQFGCAGPDDVCAEETMVVSMKEHLQQAAVVAEDVAPRDLPIARRTCFVWNLTTGQLVLCFPTIELSGME